MKRSFRTFIAAAFFGATAFGCTSGARGPVEPTPLPSMPLARLDGTQTTLSSLLAGKPALVNFWATWCDSCSREVNALNRLSKEVGDHGAGVVVGIDEGEAAPLVTGFINAHRVEYVQLLDGEFRFSDRLGERRVPTTLVVDRSGQIVHRGGALDAAALDAFRRALR